MGEEKVMVILSGGQDSTTCLFWAIQSFGVENVHAITFDYGQRHRVAEIAAAEKVVQMAGILDHKVINVRWILESASPLTCDVPLEQYEDYETMVARVGNSVEKTFVPMRNVFFLTIAVNRALAAGCTHGVVIGVSGEDSANYPDCTAEFLQSYAAMVGNALGVSNLRLFAPLLFSKKAYTVSLAHSLGPKAWEALAYTHTSYAGEYPPTDQNHANILRAKGFEEAGMPDPLVLRAFTDCLMPLPETSNYDETRRLLNDSPIN